MSVTKRYIHPQQQTVRSTIERASGEARAQIEHTTPEMELTRFRRKL